MKSLIIKLYRCCTFIATMLMASCNSSEKSESTSAQSTSVEDTAAKGTPTETTTSESAAPASVTDSSATPTTALTGNIDLENGKNLYNTNCVACHLLSKDPLVGPGLAGITEKRTVEWLVPWIKNSQKVIASGDKYGVELFNKYNRVPMPSYENFSDDDVKSILAYIEQNQVK